VIEGRGEIPGYGFGVQATGRSPLGIGNLDLLKQTVLFTEEDEDYLRLAGDVLEDQADTPGAERSDAPDALRALLERRVTGKVVLHMDQSGT